MVDRHDGTPRRTLFRAWVIVPCVLLLVLLIAAPFVGLEREGFVMMVYPPILALLVFAGLGWLVWFVFRRRGGATADDAGHRGS